jgi:hypothetical protein
LAASTVPPALPGFQPEARIGFLLWIDCRVL